MTPRILKFRAWDGLQMLPPVDFSAPKVLESFHWLGVYDYPIMQFTGLKDKKGVEIYDGDIVDLCGRHVQIKFEIKSITTQGHGDCSTDTFAGFSLGFYGRSENFFNECEVIGNIYQNPDLLK